MLDSWFNSCISIAAAMALASCGGGGGSSGGAGAPVISPPQPVAVPFTSMEDMGPNALVSLEDGQSIEGSSAFDAGSGTTVFTVSDGTASGLLETGADGSLTRIRVDGTLSDAEWVGDEITGISVTKPYRYDMVDIAEATKGRFRAHSYQSFGVWMTGIGSGSELFGAFSAGAPMAASPLPTADGATYAGFVDGWYVDPNGVINDAYAKFQATFKIGAQKTLDVSSTDTWIKSPTETERLFEDLNFAGTLNVLATGSFSGNVNTVPPAYPQIPPMSGEANGRFYGPAGQELGGTFKFQEGVRTYIGAFGAAQ